MARSLTNVNATLYRCVPCKVAGATEYGTKRVRIAPGNVFGLPVPASGQRMVALCDQHTAAYDGVRRVERVQGDTLDEVRNAAVTAAVTRTDTLAALRRDEVDNVAAAWASMTEHDMRTLRKVAASKVRGDSSDAYVILSDDYADRLAQAAARLGTSASTLPDEVRSGILAGMSSASVRHNVADATDYSHGRGIVSLDALADATADLPLTLADTLADTEQGAHSWRPEVLAHLTSAERAALIGYAERDEADARPATRHEPTAWAQGRMVPLSGASDTVRAAALAYVEAAAYVDMLAG